jgi:hypothetical protein
VQLPPLEVDQEHARLSLHAVALVKLGQGVAEPVQLLPNADQLQPAYWQ